MINQWVGCQQDADCLQLLTEPCRDHKNLQTCPSQEADSCHLEHHTANWGCHWERKWRFEPKGNDGALRKHRLGTFQPIYLPKLPNSRNAMMLMAALVIRFGVMASLLACGHAAGGCSFVVNNVAGCSDNANDGVSASFPFCTLNRGLEAVVAARAEGCTAVDIRLAPRSVHLLNETLVMGAGASGTDADSVVSWRMDPSLEGLHGPTTGTRQPRAAIGTDDNAVITGEVPGMDSVGSQWVLSSDPRIPTRSVGRVYELDTAAAGLQLPAGISAVTANDQRLELFVGGRRMPLARWPNYDPDNATLCYLRLGKVTGVNSTEVGWGELAGDRPATWTTTPLNQVRLHGYFHIGWADAITPISAMSVATRTFTIPADLHYWPPTEGQWYYAFNLIEELDASGEWWFDTETGKIFLLPPAGDLTWQQQVGISGTAGLITVNRAKFIRFEGLSFTTARGQAFILGTDAAGISILNCTFQAGAGDAIILESSDILNGTAPVTPGHTISGGSITDMGRGGVVMSGGARITLTPSNCSITNLVIANYSEWLYTYQFGILVDGVGVYISNVDVSGSRHEALSMPGNDHIVEFSRFHHLVTEAHDAGAIHQGRDWTWRGRVIRHNLFDHIGRFAYYPGPDRSLPCNSPPTSCIRAGIYMDDHEGGFEISGNIFAGTEVAGIFSHNGRDNGPPEGGIDNNLFVQGALGLRMSGAFECTQPGINVTLFDRLALVPFQNKLWSSRYPLLAKILSNEPCEPRGNAIGLKAPNAAANVGPLTLWEVEHDWFANYTQFMGGGWLSLPFYGPPSKVLPTSMFAVAAEWNGTNPGFANAGDPLQTLNFSLSVDSPLWEMSWHEIPERLIGPWRRGVLPTP